MARRDHRLVLVVIGLATAIALASPGAARPQARPEAGDTVIDIALSSFKYAPATIRLEHGRRYVLHLVNHSDGAHDFTAKSFFDAANVAPGDRAKISKGGIDLGGGEEVSIHLTAPAAGQFKVHCSHFMHSMFGMTGEIVVS